MQFENITYSNIPTSTPTDRDIASVNGTIFDPKNQFWQYTTSGRTPAKLVNAIEIGWNGAQLTN